MKTFGASKLDSINRDAYEPAYAQLAEILRRQIARGELRPGDRLPSESRLCAQFGVSPMTVRRCVNTLIDSGLVVAYQGKGTFVRSLDLGQACFGLEGLRDQLTARDDAVVRLLEARIVRADERVARKLAIKPGDRVVYIRRLLQQGETPAMYHREYLIYDPRRPVVEDGLNITSLEGLFKGQSSEGVRSGDLTIEAMVLRREEAELLQVPQGSPALSLEHIFYTFDSRPVSWGWFVCRADRFKLSTRIGADVVT